MPLRIWCFWQWNKEKMEYIQKTHEQPQLLQRNIAATSHQNYKNVMCLLAECWEPAYMVQLYTETIWPLTG
uniref:Uncharacterized protein n=1 Tax=Anguilla anguilla TaxID=7936 RepID=A0A0E9WGP1_ANGAN